ncbi:mediator-associated protein 1-like [Tripterygium wilfordii]|uniref:Mediator-associated protein 1-like n=1 Tax=Tripterygium wilfordii TaxID=458696 RepID=A0A7J7CUS2_TRIWF|nr:uncharacterized protein LOC120012040 [Tripterygium wilfordii]KAF5737821.1 mediator-associated protein 1-like [Tripterygium wilfordii]
MNTKLPIKRKAPHPNSLSLDNASTNGTIVDVDFESKPVPFKFQRIWTEPDEIRLLQGLLDSVSLGLSFPKDLSIFFDSFSKSMSQPYSRPQLSEKLRRLRKKFRLISSRLDRGLSISRLSTHDRALYELCDKLWTPQLASTSAYGNGTATNAVGDLSGGNLVGVKFSLSPVLPSGLYQSQSLNVNELGNSGLSHVVDATGGDSFDDFSVGGDGNVRLRDLEMDYHFSSREGKMRGASSVGVGGITGKCVLEAFDQSLNEVRKTLTQQSLFPLDKGKEKTFQQRWREQRMAELGIFARRMRLVLDNYFHVQ